MSSSPSYAQNDAQIRDVCIKILIWQAYYADVRSSRACCLLPWSRQRGARLMASADSKDSLAADAQPRVPCPKCAGKHHLTGRVSHRPSPTLTSAKARTRSLPVAMAEAEPWVRRDCRCEFPFRLARVLNGSKPIP